MRTRTKAAVKAGMGIVWFALMTLVVLIYASFLWAVSHFAPPQ
ncbi:MAG TPA: hypothetical protein VI702_01185 [Nitrospiria bacterium]